MNPYRWLQRMTFPTSSRLSFAAGRQMHPWPLPPGDQCCTVSLTSWTIVANCGRERECDLSKPAASFHPSFIPLDLAFSPDYFPTGSNHLKHLLPDRLKPRNTNFSSHPSPSRASPSPSVDIISTVIGPAQASSQYRPHQTRRASTASRHHPDDTAFHCMLSNSAVLHSWHHLTPYNLTEASGCDSAPENLRHFDL